MESNPRGMHIKLEGLQKSFGTHAVLQGIDLDVMPGKFVAIVSRSGCGKSTMLRLIAGLDVPILDEPLSALDALTRIDLDFQVSLPRSRARGNAVFVETVERILQRVMGKHESHRDRKAIALTTSH